MPIIHIVQGIATDSADENNISNYMCALLNVTIISDKKKTAISGELLETGNIKRDLQHCWIYGYEKGKRIGIHPAFGEQFEIGDTYKIGIDTKTKIEEEKVMRARYKFTAILDNKDVQIIRLRGGD